MSVEKFVDILAKRLDRRNVLVKMGTGVVGGVAALMGLPQGASADYVHAKCCHLCKVPSACSCPPRPNGCVWCWSCLWGDGFWYSCCECHSSDDYCGSGCVNILCSFIYKLGQGPVR